MESIGFFLCSFSISPVRGYRNHWIPKLELFWVRPKVTLPALFPKNYVQISKKVYKHILALCLWSLPVSNTLQLKRFLSPKWIPSVQQLSRACLDSLSRFLTFGVVCGKEKTWNIEEDTKNNFSANSIWNALHGVCKGLESNLLSLLNLLRLMSSSAHPALDSFLTWNFWPST